MVILIKFAYLALIIALLYIVVTIPMIIMTFNLEESFNLTNDMIDRLFDFMDLQPKWEFIAVFEGKVGIS